MSLEYEDITRGYYRFSFLKCINVLGYGFLEKVYQKASQVKWLRPGHSAEIEHPIKVKSKSVMVGEYEADLLVDEKVIVEPKVAK